MIALLSLILVIIFIYICVYSTAVRFKYPCEPSTIHQSGKDKYFIGSGKGERFDYIGQKIKNNMMWHSIEKSANAKTCCACFCSVDQNYEGYIIARTDGVVFFNQKLNLTESLVSRECLPKSICVADYFGDGRVAAYVSVYGGKNMFLVRENGKWLDLAHQYSLAVDGDTSNAMFVKFSKNSLPDLVCLTNGKLDIYPNNSEKLEQPIHLDVPGFVNNFCVADFGKTGNQSIAVNSTSGIYMFYGLGGRAFSEIKKISDDSFRSTQFIAFDVNNDGYVDIIGNIVLINNGEQFLPSKNINKLPYHSTTIMVVNEVEVVADEAGKLYRNTFGNSNRKYIARNTNIKNANETVLCQYDDNSVLATQNFIHSNNNFPYYKIGNADDRKLISLE